MVEKKLKEMEIKFVNSRVEEGGIYVDQLFFHDPDGFMIEICNCDDLPMIPLPADPTVRSCSRVNFNDQQQLQIHQTVQIKQHQPLTCFTDDYLPCAWLWWTTELKVLGCVGVLIQTWLFRVFLSVFSFSMLFFFLVFFFSLISVLICGYVVYRSWVPAFYRVVSGLLRVSRS